MNQLKGLISHGSRQALRDASEAESGLHWQELVTSCTFEVARPCLSFRKARHDLATQKRARISSAPF